MKKVTLLNKEFHLGIGFLNELLDGTGMKLNDLASQDDAVLLPKLMYYSLVYSYKRKGKEIDFTMYDVFDWIDSSATVGGDFMKAFHLSMHENVPTDNSKKKANPKK